MIGSFFKVVAGGLLVTGIVLGLSFMSLQDAGAATTGKEAACIGSGGVWSVPGAEQGVCTTPGQTRTVSTTLQQVSNILIFIVGSVSVIMIIVGSIRYALSQGDNNAVSGAKNTILYAIIGIVLSFAAYGIVNFIVVQTK